MDKHVQLVRNHATTTASTGESGDRNDKTSNDQSINWNVTRAIQPFLVRTYCTYGNCILRRNAKKIKDEEHKAKAISVTFKTLQA